MIRSIVHILIGLQFSVEAFALGQCVGLNDSRVLCSQELRGDGISALAEDQLKSIRSLQSRFQDLTITSQSHHEGSKNESLKLDLLNAEYKFKSEWAQACTAAMTSCVDDTGCSLEQQVECWNFNKFRDSLSSSARSKNAAIAEAEAEAEVSRKTTSHH